MRKSATTALRTADRERRKAAMQRPALALMKASSPTEKQCMCAHECVIILCDVCVSVYMHIPQKISIIV